MNAMSGKSLWQLSAWLNISTRGWALAKICFSQTLKAVFAAWLPFGLRMPSQPPSMLALLLSHSTRKTLSLSLSSSRWLSLRGKFCIEGIWLNCERLPVVLQSWKKPFLEQGEIKSSRGIYRQRVGLYSAASAHRSGQGVPPCHTGHLGGSVKHSLGSSWCHTDHLTGPGKASVLKMEIAPTGVLATAWHCMKIPLVSSQVIPI